MKKILFFLGISLFFPSSYTAAQQSPLEVKLKIAERSGLFGMSGPKIIRLTLSTKNREKSLTCENVNSGNYFYFLLQNEGKWQVDADFLNDDLPKLTLSQQDSKLHSEFTGDIIADGESTIVLIGFRKTLALHKPFLFEYPTEESISKVEMSVPQEYWPGYSKVTKYLDAGDKALKDQGECEMGLLHLSQGDLKVAMPLLKDFIRKDTDSELSGEIHLKMAKAFLDAQ